MLDSGSQQKSSEWGRGNRIRLKGANVCVHTLSCCNVIPWSSLTHTESEVSAFRWDPFHLLPLQHSSPETQVHPRYPSDITLLPIPEDHLFSSLTHTFTHTHTRTQQVPSGNTHTATQVTWDALASTSADADPVWLAVLTAATSEWEWIFILILVNFISQSKKSGPPVEKTWPVSIRIHAWIKSALITADLPWEMGLINRRQYIYLQIKNGVHRWACSSTVLVLFWWHVEWVACSLNKRTSITQTSDA